MKFWFNQGDTLKLIQMFFPNLKKYLSDNCGYAKQSFLYVNKKSLLQTKQYIQLSNKYKNYLNKCKSGLKMLIGIPAC